METVLKDPQQPSGEIKRAIECPWCHEPIRIDLSARGNGRGPAGQMQVKLTGRVRPHTCTEA